MTRWQAIVFDLDDTLYPEREFVLSGFRAVARWLEDNLSCSAEESFIELKKLFESGVRGKIFNQWLDEHNIGLDQHVEDMVRVYREHYPSITPFPVVPALLSKLKSKCRLGLVSDGLWAVQQRKLNALGLAHYFDVVVFSDQLGRDAWKPSVKPFRSVIEKLGIQPNEAVYVADNPLKDFFGARQVGLNTIWCRESQGDYTQHQPPTAEHAADFSIEHLSDIEQLLESMERQ